MNETNTNYTIERARNLSRELMLRDHNVLTTGDVKLCASALASYKTAFFDRKAGKELGDMERMIIAGYAEEMAHNMRGCAELALGPTDSELCSRALKLHSRELVAKLRTETAKAA